MNDVTQILSDLAKGDTHAAEQLLPLVYEELRKLAAARMAEEAPGNTLNATALVHEAYLRLVEPADAVLWDNRGHFFAAAAEAMRRILVDAARRKRTEKHGGDRRRVELPDVPAEAKVADEKLLALDAALTGLAAEDPIAARVVELRHFAGLSIEDAATSLGLSRATAYRHWTYARAGSETPFPRLSRTEEIFFSDSVRQTASVLALMGEPQHGVRMAIDPNRVKEIFLGATEQPNESARTAYLDGACAGDAGLRDRVEALLRSHDPAGSFLGAPVVALAGLNGATQEMCDAGTPPPNDQTQAFHDAGADAMADRKKTDDESNDLAFLTPSTRPDSMGRLGHYEVLQVLGRGGFGIVFRAFDDILQRVVAVKVMAPQIATLSPARKRFVREAQSSAKVRHENVVQVYEVGEQPLPYLTMEFIPGETLQQRLDRTGPLDVSEILRIGRQIAEGLAAAHACDLIHRDIKPGNILLEGGSQKAKITDFGLARAADDASISQSGIIAGTPMFMAPEQALGHHIDQRADLFSLGSVLYQMASGRPPFRAPSALAVLKRVAEETPRPLPEIIPETPDWLCSIITKLHAKKPDDRFQSAREVADLLADCEAKLKAKQEVKNVLSAAVKPAGRKWVAATAVVLLLPVFALAVTEFAGVTHLFRPQSMIDPSKPGGDPPPASKKAAPPLKEEWVQLFNGKDLSGWGQSDAWKVVDNVLTGSAQSDAIYLKSQHADYSNFHLRAEMRRKGPGAGVLIFRTSGPNNYYINLADGLDGSLNFQSPWKWLDEKRNDLVKQDQWFLLELIANGPKLTTKIDGKIVADATDSSYSRGWFVLGLEPGNGPIRLEFKKIEIKELPPNKSLSPPTFTPFPDADVNRIEALPAAEQVEQVRRELMRRNPGFDGKLEHKIEDGVVTEFRIVTDQVTDIAPIRVFNALRVLECGGTWTNKGNGQLADLTPLKGMNLADLTRLDLIDTKVTDSEMVCFKECKNLTALLLYRTQVGDAGLVHFQDCKDLTVLRLDATQVSDAGLAHLKGCKALMEVFLGYTKVSDAGLANFKDCKNLTHLFLDNLMQVGDAGLSHFKDCKNLTAVAINNTRVGDAGLAYLKGMPLRFLYMYNTAITDLTPLQGMPLEKTTLTPKNITRGLDILRDMKSLKTIGIGSTQSWPAAEFWVRYDKGEFTK